MKLPEENHYFWGVLGGAAIMLFTVLFIVGPYFFYWPHAPWLLVLFVLLTVGLCMATSLAERRHNAHSRS